MYVCIHTHTHTCSPCSLLSSMASSKLLFLHGFATLTFASAFRGRAFLSTLSVASHSIADFAPPPSPSTATAPGIWRTALALALWNFPGLRSNADGEHGKGDAPGECLGRGAGGAGGEGGEWAGRALRAVRAGRDTYLSLTAPTYSITCTSTQRQSTGHDVYPDYMIMIMIMNMVMMMILILKHIIQTIWL